MAASAAPVCIGDVLAGKYRVERILGSGGMFEVVAARHQDRGQLYAIKLLSPRVASTRQSAERFLREARAAAKLEGEHVTKVSDSGRLESGAPYIAMEHLVGIDLRKHLEARGPLPVAEAVTHVLQACEALAEAHAAGIVHRDLKPSSLFLTRRANGTSCIKVLDIGVAKQLAQDDDEDAGAGGTPLYMAPEQLLGKKEDARCDVWAMGVVLYELLTGTTPFQSSMMPEVIARVLRESPEPPSRHRPDLPAAVDTIVLKCLQKKPEERHPSIGALAAALRAESELLAPAADPEPSSRPAGDRVVLAPSVAAARDSSVSDVPPGPASAPSSSRRTPMLEGGAAEGPERPDLAKKRASLVKRRAIVRRLAAIGAPAAALALFAVWLALRSSPSDPGAPRAPDVVSSAAEVSPPAADPPAAPASAAPAASDSAAPSASTEAAPSASAEAAPSAEPVKSTKPAPASSPKKRRPR